MPVILDLAVRLSLIALLSAVGSYAYLGSFSRYLSDDYCEAVRFKDVSLIDGVVTRYLTENWRAAGRYSNILFVGFSEMLGSGSIPVAIVSMVVLWTIGLSWLVREIRKYNRVEWSPPVDVFLGSAVAFMSLLQAPNLFQTVYWRSSMMTHFAPLVFNSLLIAFLARQARRPAHETVSPFIYGFIFAASFVLAGFSEPPAATMVTAFALLALAVWMWNKSPVRNRLLALTGFAFAGAFTGLLTLMFSPAVANVAREKSPDVFAILFTSFKYALDFMRDSFTSLPLPLFLSFLIPFLLLWLLKQSGGAVSIPENRRLPVWMIVLPLLAWLLIAAGFSPSVFGQGFPVERMRFLARVWLIATLMLEGAWLGMLLPGLKFNRAIGTWFALIVFGLVSAVYPLRTASYLLQKYAPEYRERAMLWDLRQAFILRHIAQGETQLVVPGLGGWHGVKELDSNPAHWVNACAANFYGVESIQSVSEKNLLEALLERP